ncbi:hypothetical protein V8F33_014231 [Rhypophila sp. PSN 637]
MGQLVALLQRSPVFQAPAAAATVPSAPATSFQQAPDEPIPPVQDSVPPSASSSVDTFSTLTVRELAKQSLTLAEKDRLSGPENYNQALQIPDFLAKPAEVSNRLPDPQKAALLLTLRNTLKEGPLNTIAYETDPAVAFTRLKAQYEPTQLALRTKLLQADNDLKFNGGLTIVDFNAQFNTPIARLRGLGVEFAQQDQLSII